MVKQFQVGKRYRFKEGSGREFLCLFVDEKTLAGFFSAVDSYGETYNVHLHRDSAAKMEIVPPKPRTGKGYLLLHEDGSANMYTQTQMKSWPKDYHQIFPIEWTEVIGDKDSAG